MVNCLSEVNGPKAAVTPTEETQGSGRQACCIIEMTFVSYLYFFLYSTNNYLKFKAIKGKYLTY